MTLLKGIPVSPGVAIGRAFVLDDARQRIPRRRVPQDQVGSEGERLSNALSESIDELKALRTETEQRMGDEAAKIFAFHVGMLSDPSLTNSMRESIEGERYTAEYAAATAFNELARRFAQMPDPTFRTKVDDVRDLAYRVLGRLVGEHARKLEDVTEGAIVVARTLTPSQAAGFDRDKVAAFATELGGRTSHTAIVARALGIPAVVGCGMLIERVAEDAPLILDGSTGRIIVDPSDEEVERYERRAGARRSLLATLRETASDEPVTTDGERIELLGNIEFPAEATQIVEAGGDGVGLYRTEFLYLTKGAEPSEEEHFAAYRETIERLEGRPLTVRTTDIGSDKYADENDAMHERNPALGCRSIRYSLQALDVFKWQLRALLRASALGPLKIMFPLVTNLSEFRQARQVLRDVMDDLHEERIEFDENVPIGLMIEAPAAAIMADEFAQDAAFLSIGTNDLVQYTLAVDRTNERVASMYNPTHPAVTRLVDGVVQAAAKRKTPISVCGESAGDLESALLLIGLGVRTLSVAPSAMPMLKRLIRRVSAADCEAIADHTRSLVSEVAIAGALRDQARTVFPEAFDSREPDPIAEHERASPPDP